MGGGIKFNPLGDIKSVFGGGSTPNIVQAPTGKAVSNVSSGIDSIGSTNTISEEDSKRKGINKKRSGTQGTQVPLQSTKTTAPTTGVQI